MRHWSSLCLLVLAACGDDAPATTADTTAATDTAQATSTDTTTSATDSAQTTTTDTTPSATDTTTSATDTTTSATDATTADTTTTDTAPEVVTPGPTWASPRQYGTSVDDEALDLVVEPDGSVLVAGYDNGLLDISNIRPAGDTSGWVRRFDPDGDLVTTWRLSTSTTDVVEGVLPGADGGITVVGRTAGALGTTANAGQFDLVIADLDAAGTITRLAQLGDARPQHPRHITPDGTGGFVVAGYDDEFIDHAQLMDAENAFVARYARVTPEGAPPTFEELAYARSQATFNPDRVEALTVHDGVVYTGGFRFLQDDEGPPGGFIARRALDDTDAAADWRTFLAVAGTQPFGIVVTTTRVFVVGTAVFSFDPGMEGVGGQDGFVAALDLTGATLWVLRYGTAEIDELVDIALAPDGALVVAGTTFGTLPGQTPAGMGDACVLVLDPDDGAVLQIWQGGSTATDGVSALGVGPDGRTFIAGGTEGALESGKSNAGRVDAFVRQVPLPAR